MIKYAKRLDFKMADFLERLLIPDSGPETLVLGSGTSTGVPLIGCVCPICTSKDEHDKRMRSSVYLTCRGYGLLIDASADFRYQALRFRIPRIDSVLISHAHADHVFGLDEVRQYNRIQDGQEIKLYSRSFADRSLHKIFSYIATPPANAEGLYRPKVIFDRLSDKPKQLGPFLVRNFVVEHGPVFSTGFRIDAEGKSFGYVPDCKRLDEYAMKLLSGVDLLIIDGLRDREHPSHFSIEDAVKVMNKLNVRAGRFTHISHDVLHEDLLKRYPGPRIMPAHDGMRFVWGKSTHEEVDGGAWLNHA